MKYYIIEDKAQYVLYKVADTLIEQFERQYSTSILVQGNSMQETIQLFGERATEMTSVALDSVAVKYKGKEPANELKNSSSIS